MVCGKFHAGSKLPRELAVRARLPACLRSLHSRFLLLYVFLLRLQLLLLVNLVHVLLQDRKLMRSFALIRIVRETAPIIL